MQIASVVIPVSDLMEKAVLKKYWKVHLSRPLAMHVAWSIWI